MQDVVNELKAFVRYFGFWLLICFIDRLIFISSFYEKIGGSKIKEILRMFYHGLSLDFSTVAYISALPFVIYSLVSFIPKWKIGRKWLDIYTLVLIVVFFVVSFINVNVYREWGDKISKRAIDAFFASPSGAVASAESTPIFFPILGMIVGIVLFYYIYKRLFKEVHFGHIKSKWGLIFRLLIGAAIIFTFIRGGYGRATLNPSKAYYSEEAFNNHAAVSTQWALLRDYFKSSTLKKSPYNYFPESEDLSNYIKPAIANNPDSAINVLTTQRPNIVLVLLEGFVGDLVESMGGEKGITPHMESFIKEGVFFDKIYSASDRSDKGVIGTFSAFPAQGPESVIKYIAKHENMYAFMQELDSAGYHNSFYHGGQSEFYNVKSYMLTHGVERVVDNANFSPAEERVSWGVTDEVVLNRMIKDLRKEETPFYSSIFTLVNHEPFQLKGNYKFGSDNNANKFRSTAYYTDSVLYDFVEKAKKEAWYKNTLFIFIADHGHRLPAEKYEISHPNRFHIPLLLFGEVLKPEFIGKKISRIGNQTDLATTLLHQLGLPTEHFHWSRDLFNPTTPQVAFYNSKDAFGIITPEQSISFDNVGKVINYQATKDYPTAKNDSLLNVAKAYYQTVYKEFLKY
ncbi:sulfatase-like hydrolase/transferase [Sphingobacterium sp. DK4209]|uniref:Sulfatase-like hydrolase/transferase n=1 Tax=Sphingobacterium zhuxiongii TaxID=2662364 RepID=A0A5Q0QEX4_9SPHI|nr:MULTISPECIES: LTA synthase family protein [unclassified Sphingobacterium]MVZ64384.1 sulfatase-like hydrolase/transferase [Sphingobacterium sp. DK4209]QGA25730.1 sulfatase-like hydrolase/transferase [Sphingobacterium sp. dk4302]